MDAKIKTVDLSCIMIEFRLITGIPKCLLLKAWLSTIELCGRFNSDHSPVWSVGQPLASRMLISYRLRNHHGNKTSTDKQFPMIDYILSMQNIASKLVLQGFSRLIKPAASGQWSAGGSACRADNSGYSDYTFSRAPQFELEKWEIYNNT